MSQPDIITISSYNAPEFQSASNFEAILANTIVYPKKIVLTKFVMPNWIYDISPNYNKINFTVKNTATNINYNNVVTLSTTTHWPTGTAFATYLTTTINTAMVAVGSPNATPVTVTFDVTTGKLTIVGNGGYTFTMNSWQNPDPITAQSATYKLGFTNISGAGYNGNFTASLTGDSNLNLLGTSIIYVSCSLLGNAQNDKKGVDGTVLGDETILCAIPVNANFGEMIIYQDLFGQFISSSVNSLRTIKINLLNEEYNQIVLPRRCYATFEFRLSY